MKNWINGHTGIVYNYNRLNDFVTILTAIGNSGSSDEETNKKNGGYPLSGVTRTAIYQSKGEALFAHKGLIGCFRPQK